jgi:uncharacterized protein
MKYDSVQPNLQLYIENAIIPLYDTCDKGHGRDHILKVISRSMELIVLLDMHDINPNIVYTVAAYHDLGLTIGPRDIHERNSGVLVKNDSILDSWFTSEEIQIIKEAVEDHRASSTREPRSIYGKIVADADKDIDDVHRVIIRAYHHGANLNPNYTYDEERDRVKKHMIKKFGRNGYVKFYFPNEKNQKFMNALSVIAEDDQLFMKTYEKLIPRY